MTKHSAAGSDNSLRRWCKALLAAAVIGASLCLPLPLPGSKVAMVSAQMPAPPQLGTLPEGEITAVGATALDIDGTMYPLHPNLTVISDKGESMELKQLRPGLIIQYRLKEGALYRIIVLTPR